MHLLLLVAVALQWPGIALAEEPLQFQRWIVPRLHGKKVWGRQNVVEYNPGYPPEFGSCGSGHTCEDACGVGYKLCNASTTLSLFCYNPGAGETCCPNGSGRACIKDYTCAWNEVSGRTYCCRDGQTTYDCNTIPVPPPGSSTTITTTTTVTSILTTKTSETTTVTVNITQPSNGGGTTTATDTVSITVSGSGGGGGTTTTETVSIAVTTSISPAPLTVTVTLAGQTTTLPGRVLTVTSTVTEPGTCPVSNPTTPLPPSTSSTSCTSTSPQPSPLPAHSSTTISTATSQPPAPLTITSTHTHSTWEPVISPPCYEVVVDGVTFTVTNSTTGAASPTAAVKTAAATRRNARTWYMAAPLVVAFVW